MKCCLNHSFSCLIDIDVYFIKIRRLNDGDSEKLALFRLFVLSHRLGFKGIPNTISDKSFNNKMSGDEQSIIVFDIFKNFTKFQLPTNFDVEHDILTSKSIREFGISYLLQKSFTIYDYYQDIEYNPLFFSSFLIFPEQNIFFQRFIWFIDGKILIKSFYGVIDISVFESKSPQYGRFVLLSPSETPYKILCSNDSSILLQTFENKVILLKQLPSSIVCLAHLNSFIYSMFTNRNIDFLHDKPGFNPKIDVPSQINLEEHNAQMEMVFRYYSTSKTIFLPEINIQSVLYEQTNNESEINYVSKLLLQICEGLVLRKGRFIEYPYYLLCKQRIPSKISSLPIRVDFSKEVFFEKISIPCIKICKGNQIRTMSIDQAYENWVSWRLIPISGVSNLKFAVLIDQRVNIKNPYDVFRNIGHMYTLYGLGSLDPVRNLFTFLVTQSNMISIISELSNICGDSNCIVFLVTDNADDFLIGSKFCQIIITPKMIEEMSDVSLCFYISRKSIHNHFSILSQFQHFETLFVSSFPIVLSFYDKFEYMHIVYNFHNKKVSMVNCFGLILLSLSYIDINQMHNLVQQIRIVFPKWRITLTFIGDQIEDYMNEFILSNHNMCIFLLNPSPSLQYNFEDYNDDILVCIKDIICNDQSIELDHSVYLVISGSLGGYSITEMQVSENGIDIEGFAKHMSYLSWLQTDPSLKERTSPFPPHVSFVIQEGIINV